ncbi:hypothetical protein PT974_02789 [Cladobotryum mycophilum]|uniref:CRIB domain-containing protein n=1 Tax=Cladobotryum mycophilum TaxID=491253 RepID=A0ABR0SZ45_9HYPO
MWTSTSNAMAIYSGLPPVRPGAKLRRTPPKSSTAPSSPQAEYSSPPMSTENLDEFFGPAMDRPPSPERIRQVNQQMKQSYLQRHPGHRAAFSASSSISSLHSEFLGWEQSLDNLPIIRRPSVLSTEGKSPNRERDNSPTFSRNILHRRRGSKRENSINSSAASSLYSTDSSADNGSPGQKESFRTNLFSRRKPSRDDTSQKKFQISNPFNFKHVLHTDRETIPEVEVTKPSDMLAMNVTGFGMIKTHDISSLDNRVASNQAAFASEPRRFMRRIRSQEQLRAAPSLPTSPPRPPRSPTSPILPQSLLPIPPPRVSSRKAAYPDVNVHLANLSLVRPKTSGGFRHPQPFSPTHSLHDPMPLPISFHLPPTPPKRDDSDENDTTASIVKEAAWPLASPVTVSFESPLPDVPEEEEQNYQSRKSRLSIGSNSSIKGNQSAAVLRLLSKSQRPMSGTSETLGRHDLVAAHPIIVESSEEGHGFHFGIIEESWEDDIDYCYEHEAEANCDYQWERASLDTARDATLSRPEAHLPIGTAHSSPGLLSVSGFDMPALSPVSQASTGLGSEAVTPTSNPPMLGNFSLPRVGRTRIRASHASSFKESHGFTLSPSLLIPSEMHHQLLLTKVFRDSYTEDEELMAPEQMPVSQFDDDVNSSLSNKLSQWFHQRSSTSTTDTSSTSRTDSSGDRHHSANSSWSFLTRPTTSSTSVSKMTGSYTEATEPLPATHSLDRVVNDAQDATLSPTGDTVPELTPFAIPQSGKMSYHKAHASESLIRHEGLHSANGFESMRARRSRARTTSMSTQAPPVGQYSLFPRSYIRPTGDQI